MSEGPERAVIRTSAAVTCSAGLSPRSSSAGASCGVPFTSSRTACSKVRSSAARLTMSSGSHSARGSSTSSKPR